MGTGVHRVRWNVNERMRPRQLRNLERAANDRTSSDRRRSERKKVKTTTLKGIEGIKETDNSIAETKGEDYDKPVRLPNRDYLGDIGLVG